MLTGLRQGCLLSPMLLLLVIDWIVKTAQWTLTTRLEDLDFADDLTLTSDTLTDMQKKLDRLASTSLKTGLSINTISQR